MLFEAKGKTYTLVFDYNALADIEEASGMGVAQLFSEQRGGSSTIRYLMWGGLRARVPNITKQKAGELIQAYLKENGSEALGVLVTKMINELKAAIGEETEEGEGAGE